MRSIALALLALVTGACSIGDNVSCATRPNDPVCNADIGPIADTGPIDAPGRDVHLPCSGACSGMTSHCLVSGGVETCVGCLSASDCSGTTAICDPSSNTCVQCMAQADCTSASAPFCDPSHSCQPCTLSTQCTRFTATPACDLGRGACVQCASNADCTASQGCQLTAHACIPFTPNTVGPCGGCVRDTECHAQQLCVAMTFTDPRMPATGAQPSGSYCLWRQDATGGGTPAGSCLAHGRPYARAAAVTSIDGTAATVCTFQESTCAALAAFRSTDCMTLDAAGDARCGVPGLNDGVCRASGTTNVCSMLCGGNVDCPAGLNCDGTGVCLLM